MLYNKSAVKNRIPVTQMQISTARLAPILNCDKSLKNFFRNAFNTKCENNLEKVLHAIENISKFVVYDHSHNYEGIRTAKQTILDRKGHCLEQNSVLYTLLKYQKIKTRFVVMKNPKGFKIKLEDIGVHPFLKFEFKGKVYLADQVSSGVYPFDNPFWYAAKQEMSTREFISFCLVIGGEDISKTHKKPKEAINYFKAALITDPNNYPAYVSMADSLVDLGKISEAKHSIVKAVKMTPGLADPYKTWGDTLVDIGNYQEAIKAYSEAAKRDSQDFQLLYTLEKRLQEFGKKSARKKVYEKRNKLADSRPFLDTEMILLRINKSGYIMGKQQYFQYKIK